MLYLKACPKCHGDVKYESDVYGRYLECLQCGLLISSKIDVMRSRTRVGDGRTKAASGSPRAA